MAEATPKHRDVIREELAVPVTSGQRIAAHLARPSGVDPSLESGAPAVLVLHEALVLTDDIRRVAGRFAAEGYVALAPDIFQGRGPMPICIVRTIQSVVRGEGPVVDDMLELRDWLAGRPDVDGERIAVVGFCMGGGFALLLGSLGDFKAAAPYYGDVAPRATRYRDICPVVAGYGGRDLGFAKKAPLLEQHLKELGVPHDVKIYPDAGHSYMSQQGGWLMAIAPFTPLRAGYDEDAAEDSWRRMLTFFGEHLGAAR
jgi:carboxymethylenebutenolidase